MGLGNKKIFVNIRRKGIAVALTGVLLLSGAVCASAAESGVGGVSGIPTGGKVQVYLKPDVQIIVKGTEARFRDVNGATVYPIIYNGSTYLPVRAISGLMQEDIEWDEYSKTVFMGKTFSNPNKIKRPAVTESALRATLAEAGESITKADPAMIPAYVRPNFLIMYDFEMQLFSDEQGSRVYPLVVNGSVYLPIRAVSQLMKETIDWDGLAKVITIGSAPTPEVEKSQATKALLAQFEKQVLLYDSATVKIQNLQKAAGYEDLVVIATEVSKDYALAAENTLAIRGMSVTDFNEAEQAAYESLAEFTQISEHYILVLENIAYMAAAEQDYSMLAETFLTFAMESQSRLDETRALMGVL